MRIAGVNDRHLKDGVIDSEERFVSIVKCAKTDDSESVHQATLESLNRIGGLESLVSPGDTVLLKPNMVCHLDYRTGAVTNPHLLRAMCRLAREAGAKRIIIAESSAWSFDNTMQGFANNGITELAKEEGAELVDLITADKVGMGIPGGRIFRRLQLPEILMQADVLINLPVMKTHDVFLATLSLKNLNGLLSQMDKKRFHRWGLAQSIVDLNKLMLPQLTVIDGTVAMEGGGPVYGTAVNLGIIISSFDTVAADTVAATVMGINPMEIEYLKLAAEQGLGCADMSHIKVCGSSINDVKKRFKINRVDFNSYREQGITIYESGNCHNCRHFMESLLTIHMKDNVDLLKGYTVILGQTATPPEKIEGELLCFGSCTRRYRDQGGYIAGCPPHFADVIEYLKARKR